ncbi:unnamed protein product (mitochondrion) [Plasmodiophora brassicae]|uniref:Cell morphogenesis protein N-terminal domain-containing protein n=1 Tax=Plasmodiophora brassicae TaxID=37360 RepID=A0A3P3YE54_PLABS|nr:unnamed protein product [Plasmodiophora brassicae]
MDEVAGDQAVEHTLGEAGELLAAWSDPGRVQMTQDDVVRSAANIISWLKRLCMSNASRALYASHEIVTISRSFVESNASNEQKLMPSTKDRALSALEQREHSVQFWVLDCMAEVLSSIDARDTLQEDCDPSIPSKLIEYCFSRLSLSSSPSVQFASCRALGALSRMFFDDVIDGILSRMKRCKSDLQAREFVIVQRAVGELHFCLDNIACTNRYLEELVLISAKIDRGVLRAEICLSLKKVFQKMLAGPGALDLVEASDHALPFWNVFARLYRLAGKWSKKAKHSLFCYSFMVTCVCLGQVSFFLSSNRDDVFKLVVNGLKNYETRAGCLAIANEYIRDINTMFFRENMDLFTGQVQAIVTVLLPKKKALAENETEIITQILVAIGHKHMHFFVNEVAASVLKVKSGHLDSTKRVVLSALALIAEDRPSEIENYNYTLGPLISALIEGDTQDAQVLCSALSCFPIICHSKPERVKTTGIRVAALTLDSNHTISVSASGALHRYAIRDPESSLILSLYALVDVLVRLHEMDIQLQIRTMNNAKVILVTYDEFLVTNNRGRGGASRVPFECWVAMRHHLESVCLLWLCHPESFVRREAWSLLKIWESDGLRQLEQSPTAIGQHSVTELQRERRLELLADYLKPDPSTEANLDHCPELYSFLKKHYQLFKGVIAWAWSFAVERMTFVIENDPVHCKSEQYALWRNHLQFVCLGVRAQSASFVECTTAKIKVDYNTKRESLQSVRQSFITLELSLSDITTFSQHVFTLSRFSSDQVWYDLKRALAMTHSSVSDSIAHNLKLSVLSPSYGPNTIRKKNSRARNLDPESEFFFHPRTLALYDRFLYNVDDTVFATFKTVPSHIMDFVSHWTSANNAALLNDADVSVYKSMLSILSKYFKFFNYIISQGSALEAPDQIQTSLLVPAASVSTSLATATSPKSLRHDISSPTHSRSSRPSAADHQLQQRRTLFLFITEQVLAKALERTDRNDELKRKVETAACDAVTELANMGTISDSALLISVLRWLETMVERNLQMSKAFSAVLKFHPAQLLKFLVRACDANTSPALADCYLMAVVHNVSQGCLQRSEFVGELTTLELLVAGDLPGDGQELARHPCTLLVDALLLQACPAISIRRHALELLGLLQPEFGDIVAGSGNVAHDSLDICLYRAVQISRNVAERFPLCLSALVDGVCYFAANVPENYVRALLQLILPWVEQFGSLLSLSSQNLSRVPISEDHRLFEKETGSGPLVLPVLTSLLRLTKQVESMPSMDEQLSRIWKAVGGANHSLVLTVVTRFLHLQFPREPDLCKKVHIFLFRSPIGDSLVAYQLHCIKSFVDDCPLQEIANAVAHSSPSNNYIIFESPAHLRDSFALLLQSASALKHPSLSQILSFVALDFGIPLTPDKPVTSDRLAGVLAKRQPRLARQWCQIALAWAMQCPDRQVSERSLVIYRSLNVWFDLRVGMHMAMRLRRALFDRDMATLADTVDLLCGVPQQRQWTGPEWTLHFVCGLGLLTHNSLPVFSLGLRLLDHCSSVANVPDNKDHILSDLRPIWSFCGTDGVSSVVAKGLQAESTYPGTFKLLLVLGRALPTEATLVDLVIVAAVLALMIELETRKGLLADSLIHDTIALLDSVRPKASPYLVILHRVVIAICSGTDDSPYLRHRRSTGASEPVPEDKRRRSSVIRAAAGPKRHSISRRVSRLSVIVNRDLQSLPGHSGMPDGILSADDLLRAIPEVTRELFVSAAMTNPTFVVDFLEDMLCSPDLSSWAKPCLWLLDSLFVGLEFDVTPHHFSKLGDILMRCSCSPDVETVSASEVVCDRLFEKAPSSYHKGALQFVRSSTQPMRATPTIRIDCSSGPVDPKTAIDCVKFFDGPVVSLIRDLSTLYVSTPENADAPETHELAPMSPLGDIAESEDVEVSSGDDEPAQTPPLRLSIVLGSTDAASLLRPASGVDDDADRLGVSMSDDGLNDSFAPHARVSIGDIAEKGDEGDMDDLDLDAPEPRPVEPAAVQSARMQSLDSNFSDMSMGTIPDDGIASDMHSEALAEAAPSMAPYASLKQPRIRISRPGFDFNNGPES